MISGNRWGNRCFWDICYRYKASEINGYKKKVTDVTDDFNFLYIYYIVRKNNIYIIRGIRYHLLPFKKALKGFENKGFAW